MEQQANANAPAARPTLVTILCILTWIGSGLGALAFLLLTIAAGAMGDMLSKIPGLGAMMGAGTVMFLVLFLVSAGKVFGAVQMWKMKKMGFYIYTVCELVAFGISAFASMAATSAVTEMAEDMTANLPEGMQAQMTTEMASAGGGFPIMGLVFSLLFIVLYGINLKKMK